MEALRNIATGTAAASNPLFRALVGAGASEAELAEAAEAAEGLWKMMDDLADSDPAAYAGFIKAQAAAAAADADKARDPRVLGRGPALVLEAQAAPPGPSGGSGGGGGGGGGGVAGLAAVVPLGQAVARVHVWAATEASGIPPPHTARGGRLAPGAPPPADWSGLTIPLAEYRAAATAPGPLPVHHFHVACHADAVRLCTAPASGGGGKKGDDGGGGGGGGGMVGGAGGGAGAAAAAAAHMFRGAFLEAVSQFVEAEYRLALSRTVRTLQVRRDALDEGALQALLQAQQAAAAVGQGAAGGGGGGVGGVGGDSSLPQGLLEQLRSLGHPGAGGGGSGGGGGEGKGRGAAVAAGGSGARKKPLIEELDAS